MKQLIYLLLVALVFSGVSGLAEPTLKRRKSQATRPNIVFILADDLGYGDLACYGHPVIKTPNLDRLAQEGTLFKQYYDSHSVCSPTRASFITGHYPSRDRIFQHLIDDPTNARLGMPNWLDAKAPSLPRALQGAGYRTAHFGKWHLGGGSGSRLTSIEQPNSMEEGPHKLPENERRNAPPVSAYGFDVVRVVHGNGPTWYNAQPYPEPHQVHYWNDKGWGTWSSKAIADAALEFLDEHHKNHQNQPFLLDFWLTDPHAPLYPTAEMRKPYLSLPEPAQTYYSTITFMDQQIGRLLAKLKELNLENDTLVIFSSDNGGVLSRGGSNGNLRGGKWDLYEGGIRVPFIARWPGHVPAGKVDNESVLNIVDLAPTFCDLTGASMPKSYQSDGVDITPGLLGRPFKRTKPMMWYHPFGGTYSQALAIRDGDWKLLMDPNGERLELFNLRDDLVESRNVASKNPDVVARLKTTLLDWYQTIPHP